MKKFLLISFLLVSISKTSSSQTPSLLWHFDTHDMSFGNAAAADLDGDGRLEIAFSCYWNDSMLYVLNAEDGSLLWKYNCGGCNDAAPIIYDVTGDGQPDVILGSSCDPVLRCFNGSNGNLEWSKSFGGTDSPPAIADIDNDGVPDILIGDFSGKLSCFNGSDGILKWKVTVQSNCTIQASPAIVDLNDDGQPDIVVATWSFTASGDSSKIVAYNGTDHSVMWQNTKPHDVMYHGVAFGDIDQDGKPELVIGSYDGTLYVLNGEDGTNHWTYTPVGTFYIGAPATLGDVNGDGTLEIIYVDGSELGVLDTSGSLIWDYIIPGVGTAFRGVALADVNGDNLPDVIFGTTNGKVDALNGSDGNLIWEEDLEADYGVNFEVEQGPVVADFDGDDTLDVFMVGGHAEYPNIQNNYGRAYAIQAGAGSGPEWLMFQHDQFRSNCLCTATPTIASGTKSNSFSVSSFPNPFPHTTTFHIRLEQPTSLYISFYDGTGNIVKAEQHQNAVGSINVTWNGTNEAGALLPAGIYYCQIICGDYEAVKKLVIER